MKKVLLTGGSGLLGTELLKINSERKDCIIFAPTRDELDLYDIAYHQNYSKEYDFSLCKYVYEFQPDLIVHCAAETNVNKIEKDKHKLCSALKINVAATTEIISECIENNIKLIYISTDHVFDGKLGYYETNSAINPLTKYAKTKAAGELCVRTYENSLVIRTSFFGKTFPFEKAFVDQFSSKDYIDIIAPKIYDAMLSDKLGIVHIGSPRRSLYEIAIERKPDVLPGTVQAQSLLFPTPIDTSIL